MYATLRRARVQRQVRENNVALARGARGGQLGAQPRDLRVGRAAIERHEAHCGAREAFEVVAVARESFRIRSLPAYPGPGKPNLRLGSLPN